MIGLMLSMTGLMIGTYGVDGTPDVMNAAWGGITLEDEITICIDTSHKTWANIAAKKAFTVAFGTADTVKACDYLGIASGNKTPDKVAADALKRVPPSRYPFATQEHRDLFRHTLWMLPGVASAKLAAAEIDASASSQLLSLSRNRGLCNIFRVRG